MTRKMVSKMPSMMTTMLVMIAMTPLLGIASASCRAACLSDELKQIKDTLKSIQHSVAANQFWIKRNWKRVAGPPPEFFCPKEMPNSCYLFIQEKKTWNGAQQFCMGRRAHLVNIESWEENNYLKQQITGLNTGSYSWWTGGSDDGVPGQWKWKFPNGVDVPVKYHDWDARQPDNSGKKETVIALYSTHHRWNDRANTYKNNFICEYDKPKGLE